MATCTFLGTDSATQGHWAGTYGADGYNVVNDASSYPAYATVTPSGQSVFNWGGLSGISPFEASSPTTPNPYIWYGTVIDLDIALTSGDHQIACYFFQNDTNNRTITVQVLDMDSGGTVLDTQVVGGGSTLQTAPVYVLWKCSGHVKIEITCSGINAIIGAFFFDPPPIPLPPSTCSLVRIDSGTGGHWAGFYGSEGYNVAADTSSYPGYATVSQAGQSVFNWGGNAGISPDEASSPTTPNPNIWFGTQLDVDIALTSGEHQLSFYFFQNDTNARSITAQVLDMNSGGAVLDTETVGGGTALLTTPVYVVWKCSGHVKVRITATGINAILGAFFFDAAPATSSGTFCYAFAGIPGVALG